MDANVPPREGLIRTEILPDNTRNNKAWIFRLGTFLSYPNEVFVSVIAHKILYNLTDYSNFLQFEPKFLLQLNQAVGKKESVEANYSFDVGNLHKHSYKCDGLWHAPAS